MFTNMTNKFWSLVTTGLADVDGFQICIQVCVWLDFWPMKTCTLKSAPELKYDRQISGHFRKVSMDIYCVLVIQCSTNIHFVVNVLDPHS